MKIFGFSLLRNGIKYDYPFRESLASLQGITSEVFLALGKSEDGTEKEIPALHVIPTVWDEAKRAGGIILSEQTNIALSALRAAHPDAWGIYLQADEVLPDFEYPRLLADLERADREGCDAISFRYLHFWQAYDQIAISKRWYPQEIRAIRLSNPAIESYGDAQSFRGFQKCFQSEASVFHYGHVREAQAYEEKKRDFHRWWHANERAVAQAIAKGKKQESVDETVRYLGPHPSFMRSRIGAPEVQEKERVVLFKPAGVSADFLQRVCAKQKILCDRVGDLRAFAKEEIVNVGKVSVLERILSLGKLESKVPEAMGSKQARPWSPDFLATLRLSEKGFSVR